MISVTKLKFHLILVLELLLQLATLTKMDFVVRLNLGTERVTWMNLTQILDLDQLMMGTFRLFL